VNDTDELLGCHTQVLELMASGAGTTELLGCITSGLERLIPDSRCSILLLDDTGRILRHGSAPSLPASYLAAIDGLETGPAAGSCGTAAWSGTSVVAEDIETDASWDLYRAAAQSCGLRSCWSTPILGRTAQPIGTFAVYHPYPHRPNDREERLVDRLTYLASVAVEHSRLFGALVESEERFRRAFEDNAVGMALLTTDGRVTRENEALLRQLGLDPPRARGAKLAALLEPGQRAQWESELEAVRTGRRRIASLEVVLVRPDGGRTPVELTLSLVRGASGEPLQISLNLLDVTERVAAQQERHARRVAEVARTTAERHSRATSDFFTGVSHEMRTPLQAITGFTELLSTLDLVGPRRAEALEHISTAANHLLALVDDTLDLARLDARMLPLFPETVGVREAVGEVTQLLAPIADRENVRLRALPTDDQVRADPRRLKQILINLVINGIRYGRTGGTVNLTSAHDRDQVRIDVRDDGPGIPAAQLDRLFRPFDRLGLDEVQDARAGGSGLGLVVARGLAEAMAGRLEITSTEGEGTTARLSLPAAPR
jgi:PAS domain S-box-containing protein